MDKRIAMLGLLTLLTLGAGCRSGAPIAGSDDRPPDIFGENGDSNATTSGLGSGGQIALTPEEARLRELMSNIVVYFDFDQADIRPEFNDMLAQHANFLQQNPNSTVRLEGHADETGSREYNIGLGERRAQAVRRILLLAGASASQLSTVSYGEERPAALGSDEESYSLNRRVELVYGQ